MLVAALGCLFQVQLRKKYWYWAYSDIAQKTNCGLLPVKKFLIDFYAKLSGDDTTKKSKKKFVAMVFLEFSANKQVKAIEKSFSL